jgi:hypothetical protein
MLNHVVHVVITLLYGVRRFSQYEFSRKFVGGEINKVTDSQTNRLTESLKFQI